MRKKCIWVVVLGLILVLGVVAEPINAAQLEKIVLVGGRDGESNGARFLSLLYTEAFGRLGLEFEYQQLPARRASVLSDRGNVDGELSRVYSYGDNHPNLIRVEEPLYMARSLVLTADPTLEISGWESFRNIGRQVFYRLGVRASEANLFGRIKKENLHAVHSVEEGINALRLRNNTVFVDAESNLFDTVNSAAFKNSNIRIAGVCNNQTAHLFLHKRHGALASKLSSILASMKKEGLFDEFRAKTGFMLQ
ncbi:MAG: hypothetical protein ISR44_03075 [Rhodospirillales bacterium]|nr:hypothetical protein [Alphaproteobacteria bacterium]MBL6928132.1 hypothetical protein [Rhodospirillales bacterium]